LKEPIHAAIRVLFLEYTSKPVIGKNNYKGKTKAKPQYNEQLDYCRVCIHVNSRPVLALVHLQTTSRDLINEQFEYLYSLPIYSIDKKSLNIPSKGLKGIIEKECDVQMDYEGYIEIRNLYVVHFIG